MITTNQINDKIEIINQGAFSTVQVRKATIVLEDGVEISRVFNRYTVNPTDSLELLDSDVSLVCSTLFTEEMKTAYTNFRSSLEVTPNE